MEHSEMQSNPETSSKPDARRSMFNETGVFKSIRNRQIEIQQEEMAMFKNNANIEPFEKEPSPSHSDLCPGWCDCPWKNYCWG